MSRLLKFPLLSAEEVANSPSRRDGVPESMEYRRIRSASTHMKAVSFEYKMGITTWATAVTFFNRFYARKSMKKNNSFIMACASLFLAGKANNKPVHHHKITNALLRCWFNRDNPQLRQYAAYAPGVPPPKPAVLPPAQAAAARRWWTDMYDAVLEAERALLYTIGFDFNVDIVHTHLARLLKRPRFRAIDLEDNKLFQQYIVNLANDVYTKDGPLLLQYPVDKIAIAAYYLIFKMAKHTRNASIPQPAPGPGGAPWYVSEGLPAEECIAITNRFTARIYNSGGAGGQKGGGGGEAGGARRPAASVGGAASTAVLGACESAAYSGGLTLPSDLGEHTSVPRPLSSDPGSALGSGAGSKRPAATPEGPGGGTPALSTAAAAPVPPPAAGASAAAAAAAAAGVAHPSKRARLEASGSQEEATSAARHVGSAADAASPSPTGPAAAPQPSAAAPAPAAAAAAVVPAVAAAAVAAAAAAAEDSEKEEGELEEGELA